MVRALAACLALSSWPQLASAESHGWGRLTGNDAPTNIGQLFRSEVAEFVGSVGVGDRVITMWFVPERTDDTKTDFLGNPLRIRAETFRCVERLAEDGLLYLEYCEQAD